MAESPKLLSSEQIESAIDDLLNDPELAAEAAKLQEQQALEVAAAKPDDAILLTDEVDESAEVTELNRPEYERLLVKTDRTAEEDARFDTLFHYFAVSSDPILLTDEIDEPDETKPRSTVIVHPDIIAEGKAAAAATSELDIPIDIEKPKELHPVEAAAQLIAQTKKKLAKYAPVPGEEAEEPAAPEAEQVRYTLDQLKALRDELAAKELIWLAALKKSKKLFASDKSKGLEYAAHNEYLATKEAYDRAAAEVFGRAEHFIEEEIALAETQRAVWQEKNKKRSWLARKWEAFGKWNFVDKIAGEDNSWKQYNEDPIGFEKKHWIKGTGKAVLKTLSRLGYGLFSARTATGLALSGGMLFASDMATAAAWATTRTGFAMAGSYFGGSGLAKGLGEWKQGRKTKKIIAGELQRDDIEGHNKRYNALLKRRAQIIESLRREMISNDETAPQTKPGKAPKQTKAGRLREELKLVLTELHPYASRVEGGLTKLKAHADQKAQEVIHSSQELDLISKATGIGLAAIAGVLGGVRYEAASEALEARTGITYPEKTTSVPQGETAPATPVAPEIQAAKTLGWSKQDILKFHGENLTPAQLANVHEALSTLEKIGLPAKGADLLAKLNINDLHELAGGRQALAERFGRAFTDKGTPIAIKDIEAVLKKNHLMGNLEHPDELFKDVEDALNTVVSAEVKGSINSYSKALEKALIHLREEAMKSSPMAITALKNFLTSESVDMGDIAAKDLTSTQINKAMLKYVRIPGTTEVREDILDRVQFGNRILITTNGEVAAIQGTGSEAPGRLAYHDDAPEPQEKTTRPSRSAGVERTAESAPETQKPTVAKPGVEVNKDIAEHPMKLMDKNNISDPVAYGHFKGIRNMEDYVQKTKDIKEFAVFQVLNDKLPEGYPKLGGGVRLTGFDVRSLHSAPGSTDYRSEFWVVSVASEKQPNVHLAFAKFETNGTETEMLKKAVEVSNLAKAALDRAWEHLRLPREEVIDFCNKADIPLVLDHAASKTSQNLQIAELAEHYRALGGDYSSLKVDGTFSATQIGVLRAFEEKNLAGETLKHALKEAQSMRGFDIAERVAAYDIITSKSKTAFAELFQVDGVEIPKGAKILYDPDRHLLTIKDISIEGERVNELTINTVSKRGFVSKGRWFGEKVPITLDTLKDQFVK